MMGEKLNYAKNQISATHSKLYENFTSIAYPWDGDSDTPILWNFKFLISCNILCICNQKCWISPIIFGCYRCYLTNEYTIKFPGVLARIGSLWNNRNSETLINEVFFYLLYKFMLASLLFKVRSLISIRWCRPRKQIHVISLQVNQNEN